MRTIQIDKKGFGLASTFEKESTKSVLIEHKGLNGEFLSELGIKYAIGDTITIKEAFIDVEFNTTGFKIHYIRIYKITGELYHAEFINKGELND